MEYKKKKNPVCKIMKSFFEEFIKAHMYLLKKDTLIENELLDHHLYRKQGYIIEYINNKYLNGSTGSDLVTFSTIRYPRLLLKKRLRKLKTNDYIKIKYNDDDIMSGILLSKNRETICICVDKISNKTLYEYYIDFVGYNSYEDRIKYHKDQNFEIRHIKKIYE